MILAMRAVDPSIKFGTPAKPIVTPKTATAAGGGAVVAGTVIAGVHQGWGITGWIAAGCVFALAALLAYFILGKKD